MPNRFWTGAVNGGTGTWDTTNTANWSATSGGAGGASVPTTGDLAFFDANSGSGVCTLGSDVSVPILNLTGYIGTLNFSTFKISVSSSGTTILNVGSTATTSGSKRVELTYSGSIGTRTITGLASEANAVDVFVLGGSDIISGGIRCRNLDFTGFSGSITAGFQQLFGDLVMSPTMTTNSGTSPIVFSSTSATPRKITSNGVTFNFELRFEGVGGTWELQDNLVIAPTRVLRANNGTINANDKNLSMGGFCTGVGTKTLNMGSGTWTLTGSNASMATSVVWDAEFAVAGLTVVPGTATINMTSASAKTFAGGARTYPTLNQGGSGALTIQQSNTFANITNTVQPATITLAAGTTQTVGEFGVSGTAGNLITLNSSTSGTRATLSDSGRVNYVSFVSIKDISATGGALWNAFLSRGNVDAGNNLGWNFVSSRITVFRSIMRSIFRPVIQ